MEKQMTPTKHPLSWFIERIGKTVVVHNPVFYGKYEMWEISNKDTAESLFYDRQDEGFTFRDPHPLMSSILTCNVISCDRCGKVGTTEDLDKEVAAKGFEGEGWKLLMDGTINCGCK